MFFRVCVTNFIKIQQPTADLQRFNDSQDGGVGHDGEWPQTPAFVFSELSMCFLVCVPNFIKFE
jgi:hypothetical protein